MNHLNGMLPFLGRRQNDDVSQIRADEIVLGVKLGKRAKNEPFSISRALLKEGHVHVRGRTRSGKTSLVLDPLACALMESYELRWSDSSGIHSRTERDAIFVFDLAGDYALYNSVRKCAEKCHRTFKYFSLESQNSFCFDPFQSVRKDKLRAIRICNLLIEAMNMDHGLIYGGSYYTQRNLAGLLRVADRAVQRHQKGEFTGLADIAEYLDRHREKDEDQIRMTFQFLLHYPQLMPAENDPNVIDMAQAIANREVIYFFCPTMGEATTARQIAGLGLYNTVNAAMQLAAKRDPASREQPTPHCWLLVDEFQEIAGKSFAAFLAQASKFGISAILANQTTNQLETDELSIADIVRDNTLAKIYFTVTGKRDIEELQWFSGDDRETLNSRSSMPLQLSLGGERIGTTEMIVPKLRKDEILDTSATFGQFFAIVDDGKGHREPIRVQSKHRFSIETFRRLRNTPLRPVSHPVKEETSRPPGNPVEMLWQRARKREPDQSRKQRLDMLARLIKVKKKHPGL